MENTFLKGNDVIEALIRAAAEDEAGQAGNSDMIFEQLGTQLTNRMNAGGHLIVAVDVAPDDPDAFRVIPMEDGAGHMFWAVYTSEEEFEKSGFRDKRSFPIDVILRKTLDQDDIYGIDINSHSAGCRLMKNFLWSILSGKKAADDDFEWANHQLSKAIRFASWWHEGQLRKGSREAYITHPIEVISILNGMSADRELMTAAALHDVVEDTDAEMEDIVWNFGYQVAALVAAVTVDNSRPWQERKQDIIDDLAASDERVRKLKLADVLANLRSMRRDGRIVGEKLWDRFGAPKDRQEWYYGELLKVFRTMEGNEALQAAVREADEICTELFGHQI